MVFSTSFPPPPSPPPDSAFARRAARSASVSSSDSSQSPGGGKSVWNHRIRDILDPKWMLTELPWVQRFAPAFLHPDFTWRPLLIGDIPLTPTLPDPGSIYCRPYRLFLGRIHDVLSCFSKYYCAWFGVPYSYHMSALPFGIVLKFADGTSIDEVLCMKAIRKAGIPAPKVISYGEHPSTPHAPISILMTRLPGDEWGDVEDDMTEQEQKSAAEEMGLVLKHMRSWPNPWSNRICGISGGSMRSVRVPNHRIKPFETEQEFNEFLLAPASNHSFPFQAAFEEQLAQAQQMQRLDHKIVFTHGDFALHNIMVSNGRITGFIDWETAGWYPEYWEFTTPLRGSVSRPEWRALLMSLGGDQYLKELECELAIMKLTVDSWVW